MDHFIVIEASGYRYLCEEALDLSLAAFYIIKRLP